MADGSNKQMNKGVARSLGALLSCDVSLSDDTNNTLVSGITADSRQVEQGFIFAALKGVNLDGTRFVDQAIEAGAVAILV